MTSSFKWLHLSDFHFDPTDHYDQSVVLRPLVDELRSRVERGWRPDAVFCTGDIAQSGGGWNRVEEAYPEYERACEFFDKVLQVLNLDKERFFSVPGNHDVDQNEYVEILTGDQSEVTKIMGNVREHPDLLKPFHGYKWFIQEFLGREFCPKGQPYDVHHFTTDNDVSVGIIELNSAWRANGEHDQGDLIIGERAVRDALTMVKKTLPDVVITLVHHPLDWLKWWDRDQVQALLEEESDLLLRGHLHSQRIANIATGFGAMVTVAAGAAYQTRDWPNQVVTGEINVDNKTVWTTPLEFKDQGSGLWSEAWSPAPRVNEVAWKVNPPTEKTTVLLQEALWKIPTNLPSEMLGNATIQGTPNNIKFSPEPTDWEEEKNKQEQWFDRLSSSIAKSPRFTVFSTAHVPLAVHLGYLITNRYPAEFFQWDPEMEKWKWRDKMTDDWEDTVSVEGLPNETVDVDGPVAIRISVSAFINEADILEVLPQPGISVHLFLKNPSRSAITSPEQVNILGKRFAKILSHLRMLCPNCDSLHLFAAVPTAVAVNIGRQINPTMDPITWLYQYRRKNSPVYTRALCLD